MTSYALPIHFPSERVISNKQNNNNNNINNSSEDDHKCKASQSCYNSNDSSSDNNNNNNNNNNDFSSQSCSSKQSSASSRREQQQQMINAQVKSAAVDPCQITQGCSLDSSNAVRFELFICFNGRKYKANRTMSKFLELRQKLLKEIQKKGGSIHIPELPASSLINTMGFITGVPQKWGFGMLQSMLTDRVSMMEEWLSYVCSMMPTSPSLSTFLWEPVESPQSSDEQDNSSLSPPSGNKCKKQSSLYSIAEEEGSEEEEHGFTEEYMK